MLGALVALAVLVVTRGLDVHFVRHGARAPLVTPMLHVFKVLPEQLTEAGRSQAYYYGKEIKRRHHHLTSDHLIVYSTDTQRTRMSAEYFIKGWNGINKEGRKRFEASPKYLPPCHLGFIPQREVAYVDEKEYSCAVHAIPDFEDHTGRNYYKYVVSDFLQREALERRVAHQQNLCQKFRNMVPSSCRSGDLNEYFNFMDIFLCMSFVNQTVPNVSPQEMKLPLDIVNHEYLTMFLQQSFPTKAVQQDFLLVQHFNRVHPNNVVVVFTHDAQLFFILRSLLGVKGVFELMGGNMVMKFLSCLHFKVEEGEARLFFNDKEIFLPGCLYERCSVERLFEIMNE